MLLKQTVKRELVCAKMEVLVSLQIISPVLVQWDGLLLTVNSPFAPILEDVDLEHAYNQTLAIAQGQDGKEPTAQLPYALSLATMELA